MPTNNQILNFEVVEKSPDKEHRNKFKIFIVDQGALDYLYASPLD